MQLHTYVMNRLLRWKLYVIWCADARTPPPGPKSVKSWWLSIVQRPNVRMPAPSMVQRAACPVDEIECGIIQLCIEQLPEHLRDVVLLGYLASGTAEDKARELGCCRATYFNRLNAAYAELLGLLNDHEAGVKRVDVAQVNEALEAERANVPATGQVSGRIKRPVMHGISRDVRAELAPTKKAATGA